MLWIYDFANALVCIILIVIACRIKIIPLWIGYILGIYSFLPFFINDFLFQAEYMVDQFSYVAVVKEARSLNFLTEIVTSDKYETGIDKNFIAQIDWKTLLTGWSLALLPLPFTETVSSLGFFNRFLFILIFLWLYKKNFLNGISLFFILFYPSFVLYTSLSLRDPLVTSLMIVSVIFLIEKKYLSFLISIAPIYFLKFQNFYIMLALFLIYILFQRETFVYRIRYVLIGLIVIGFTPFVDQIISYMNIVHIGMINENGGTFENYKNYDGIYDLIKNSVFAFPNFLMKPLPWDAINSLQAIQSIENMFVLIFLIIFTSLAYKKSVLITNKWLLFLIFSLTIYGLVIVNIGTSARYRYPFILTYVIGLSYELYKMHNFRFNNIFKIKF